MRLQAVRHLKSLATSASEDDAADADFVKTSFVNALSDPDSAVVQEALETPAEILARFIPRDELAEALLTALACAIAEVRHSQYRGNAHKHSLRHTPSIITPRARTPSLASLRSSSRAALWTPRQSTQMRLLDTASPCSSSPSPAAECRAR